MHPDLRASAGRFGGCNWFAFAKPYVTVSVYELGLVMRKHSSELTLRFEDLEGTLHLVVDDYVNGVQARQCNKLTLIPKGRRGINVPGFVGPLGKELIERLANDVAISRVLDTLKRNPEATVGKFAFRNDSFLLGKKWIPFKDVESVDVRGGYLKIRKRGLAGTMHTKSLRWADIVSAHAVFTLLERGCKSGRLS